MLDRVLLLGGIGEAIQIARYLIQHDISLIYSIAGLVRTPDLDCEIRTGGFSKEGVSSAHGLARYITANSISLLINATHPYAAIMSENAANAARRVGIPCWRYLRPEWRIDQSIDLHSFSTIESLLPLLEGTTRPFFTIGQGILGYRSQRPNDQHWVIRSALPAEETRGLTLIDSIGPFSYEQDLALMQMHQVDALVSKNSGGTAIAGKIQAAREMQIPVYLMERPKQSSAYKEVFDSVESICSATSEFFQPA